MVQARRPDAEAADLLVAAVVELGNLDPRRQLVEIDGEEGVVHPQPEELAHRARLLRPLDPERRLRVVGRTEEGNALDVVPVKMREEQVDRERARPATIHERRAELA